MTDTYIAARPAGHRTGTTRATHAAHDTACRCGQQLDCCARRHCPRCGREVGTR